MQQNEKSAQLFDTLLNHLPLQTRMPDKKGIINEVIIEIWEHPCPAYARLREKIKTQPKEILKRRINFPMDEYHEPTDPTKVKIRYDIDSLVRYLKQADNCFTIAG